jgi:hypothetical protein
MSANVDGAVPDGFGTDGQGGDYVVTPPDITLDCNLGMPNPSQVYKATTFGGLDVSMQSTWTIDNTALGTLVGSTFTASCTVGGDGTIYAMYQGKSGFVTIHVRLHARITDQCGPGDGGTACPTFPMDTTPPCTDTARAPTIVYPPDQALLPPNMNVIEVQWDHATGNTVFEIDFANKVTDVRVVQTCVPITDSRGVVTSGCGYSLSQSVWDYVAQSNRGGDPVTITVRAADATGACIAASAKRSVFFAQEDINGGIYYWQSLVANMAAGKSGGIFRYDFGARNQAPDPFLTPTTAAGTCIGCHALSRDGQKMTYGYDDGDSDDEYSDLHSRQIDVGTKKVGNQMNAPGFQALMFDHSAIIGSDGNNQNTPPAFFYYDGNYNAAPPTKVPTGASRGTQPDWSPDGTSVVYVVPKTVFPRARTTGSLDDHHFVGGSLFLMSYTASTKAFGTPTSLLASAGENNYYPGFSPDNRYIAFNRVPLTGNASDCTQKAAPFTTRWDCPNDSFSNEAAKVLLLSVGGGTPIDLPALNDTGKLTNSWPRWAPFITNYKGRKQAWITFSSTRDYGYHVRNQVMVPDGTGGMITQMICYPPDGPEVPEPPATHFDPYPPNCRQPQIWMSAIDLTTVDNMEFQTMGADPSYPAFWLPFQEVLAHNHSAQWAAKVVVGPPTDGGVGVDGGGACVPSGGDCSAATAVCCVGAGVCFGVPPICTTP